MTKVVVGTIEKQCVCCGNIFTTPHSRKDRLSICSSACRASLRRSRAYESLQSVIFDPEDREMLANYLWVVDSLTGYVRTKIGSRNVSMHRMLMGLEPGDERHVDHKNGNRIDNRRSNLRVCTAAQNACNVPGRRARLGGMKGVYWHSLAKKWCAGINANGVHTHLGLFESEELAHSAYRNAAIEIHGEFANFGA